MNDALTLIAQARLAHQLLLDLEDRLRLSPAADSERQEPLSELAATSRVASRCRDAATFRRLSTAPQTDRRGDVGRASEDADHGSESAHLSDLQ